MFVSINGFISIFLDTVVHLCCLEGSFVLLGDFIWTRKNEASGLKKYSLFGSRIISNMVPFVRNGLLPAV